MEAVRILCRPHEEVATALAVLEENERLLHDSRGSSGGWLRRLLGRSADTAGRQPLVQGAVCGAGSARPENGDHRLPRIHR